MRRLLFPALMLLSLACAALPDASQIEARALQFGQARGEDLELMLKGPDQPGALAVPAGLSCIELYEKRLALQRSQLSARPGWAEDPRNQAAVAIGTMNTWGFAMLPFTAMQSYTADARQGRIDAELDALRYASARQQCFVR